jgi:hypothetical protein
MYEPGGSATAFRTGISYTYKKALNSLLGAFAFNTSSIFSR